MKPYQIAMALALAGAGGLLLFGDQTPSDDIAEPVARSRPTPATAARSAPSSASSSAQRLAGPTILALSERATLVGESGEATFVAGEGVFLGQNWNPPPPPPPPVSNAPPPPPMAPPLPFTVLGKGAADGVWEVYLAHGDKTYVVKLQTVIDGTYRIDRIAPPLMFLTYLPLNQVQQMNIGVLD